MFEAVELGRKLTKQSFEKQLPDLRLALLERQRALHASNAPVIVIVAGVEGAGKSEVVNRLTEWLDPRGVNVHAFWDETDEERQRPGFWRFWRAMPRRGTIGIFFGSWYTDPIVRRATGEIDDATFEHDLRRVVSHERMLIADGTVIVKLWFHLGKKDQEKRLKKLAAKRNGGVKINAKKKKSGGKSPLEEFASQYDSFVHASETAIRITDTAESPWHLIEARNQRYRDFTAGRVVVDTLVGAVEGSPAIAAANSVPNADPALMKIDAEQVTVLDRVDLSQALDKDEYNDQLRKYQQKLHRLAWDLRDARRSCVAVFEGWDAAGKGGAIRRVTTAMDARLFQVVPIAAPTDEEHAQHYLWRFWRHIPPAGRICIFDRSWYGRVLVERVEGFTPPHRWRAAYRDINEFEQQLVESGIHLAKFWLHISKDEQLKRFEARQRTPWKQHKINDEDWRNREKWDDYRLAVNDMVAYTSSTIAPWTLVAANDKRFARIEVARKMCELMEKSLG